MDDIGSSYLLNEISAAFLWAQLQEAKKSPQNVYKYGKNIKTNFLILKIMANLNFNNLVKI